MLQPKNLRFSSRTNLIKTRWQQAEKMIEQEQIFLKNTTAIVSLTVGVLGFLSAIGTLIFTARNNNRNYKLQAEIDEREKTKSYNRVLGNLLKVYHSYIRHKHLYNDDGMKDIPDNSLIKFINKIDNFEFEINRFKIIANNESEIIPELTIQIHGLLDILSRFQLMTEQIPNDEFNADLQKNKLVLKRAHIFAVSELLDKYFSELINDLSKKADVDNEFQKTLSEFNSDETIEKNLELQKILFDRMIESLSKQLNRAVTMNELLNG